MDQAKTLSRHSRACWSPTGVITSAITSAIMPLRSQMLKRAAAPPVYDHYTVCNQRLVWTDAVQLGRSRRAGSLLSATCSS